MQNPGFRLVLFLMAICIAFSDIDSIAFAEFNELSPDGDTENGISYEENSEIASVPEEFAEGIDESVDEEQANLPEWCKKPPKYNRYGTKLRINPLSDSEEWIIDPSQDLSALESVHPEAKSKSHSENIPTENAHWQEMATRTGTYPKISKSDERMHYMDFSLPPTQLSVSNTNNRSNLTKNIQTKSIEGILPLVRSYCPFADKSFSFDGYSYILYGDRRAKSKQYLFYNGIRVEDAWVQVNWKRGVDGNWHILSVPFFIPCEKLEFSHIEDEGFVSSTDENSNVNISLKASLGIDTEIKSTVRAPGGETLWYCNEGYCELVKKHISTLKANGFDREAIHTLCNGGTDFSSDEDIQISAYVAYADDSIVHCTFEPVLQGNAVANVDIGIAVPYKTSTVRIDAWYGNIHDGNRHPLFSLDKDGNFDYPSSPPVYYYDPLPDPYLHYLGSNYPRRILEHEDLDHTVWSDTFPWFYPPNDNGSSYWSVDNSENNTNLSSYDIARINASAWYNWAIQLNLDTNRDISGGFDLQSTEPLCNLKLAFFYGGGQTGTLPDNCRRIDIGTQAISTAGGIEKARAVGFFLHEYGHTLHSTWENNFNQGTHPGACDVTMASLINETHAEAVPALLTKGATYAGGGYTNFAELVEYYYFPGGKKNTPGHDDCFNRLHLLEAINYQMQVLSHQVGWDVAWESAFYPVTGYSISGWVRTGTMQEAFSDYGWIPTHTQKTYLDITKESAKLNGFARYWPVINNHYNRTLNYDYSVPANNYETPNYLLDEIGNHKKHAPIIILDSYSNMNTSINKKPSNGGDLFLSRGSGDEEDYDYYSFFAPKDILFDIIITFSTDANSDYKISLHNENGSCLVGFGCPIEPVLSQDKILTIEEWESPESEFYYFRVYNNDNSGTESEPTYEIDINRGYNSDSESDEPEGAEPTFISSDNYLVPQLNGEDDIDYFRIVVPADADKITVWTCDHYYDNPSLELQLYSSDWDGGRLIEDQWLLFSVPGNTYSGCSINHAILTYEPAAGIAAGIYFIKVLHSTTGNDEGDYKLYVEVLDADQTSEIVDGPSWEIPMENPVSNENGSFQIMRGYLSSSGNTDATTMCTDPRPSGSPAPAQCQDKADFYEIFMKEGQTLSVSSRGGVELSIWATNNIHSLKTPPANVNQATMVCTDIQNVGCAPLVEDKSYALDDDPTSGELIFVSPIEVDYQIGGDTVTGEYYQLRVVRQGTDAVDYTLYLHLHPTNLSWQKTEPLKFPVDYPRPSISRGSNDYHDIDYCWQFEESSGSTTYSSAAYNHDQISYAYPPYKLSGNIIGSAWSREDGIVEKELNVLGNSIKFDGSIGNYIDITNEVIPDGADEYTAMVWFNPTDVGTGRQMILETSQNWSISIEIDDNGYLKYWTCGTSSSGITTDIIPTENIWHHVTVVYDDDGGNPGYGSKKIYYDGVKLSAYGRDSLTGTLCSTNGLHIGTYRSANDRWFKGQIDNVRVFNEALTENVISQIYNKQTRRWPYHENAGNTVDDFSKYDIDGTLNGAYWYDNDLYFDGLNDYVNVSEKVISNGADEYTAMAWFKPTNSLGYYRQSIMETTGSYSISIELTAGDGYLKYWTCGTGGNLGKDTGIRPFSGVWHHVAVVYNKNAGYKKIYLNGVELSAAQGIVNNDPLCSTNGLNVGTYRNADGRWFRGAVREVRVYHRALDGNAINYIYNWSEMSWLDNE